MSGLRLVKGSNFFPLRPLANHTSNSYGFAPTTPPTPNCSGRCQSNVSGPTPPCTPIILSRQRSSINKLEHSGQSKTDSVWPAKKHDDRQVRYIASSRLASSTRATPVARGSVALRGTSFPRDCLLGSCPNTTNRDACLDTNPTRNSTKH